MGFCHRCGEITVGKCGRCGGRSIESTLSSLNINNGETISLMDKWQSQYENGILAPEDLLKKAKVGPKAKKIPVTQSEFYAPPDHETPTNVCTCCSKILKSFIVEDLLPYCNACHKKLFAKGECPTCQKTVSQTDPFVEHSDQFWHRNCFNCFNCSISLKDAPMVDVLGRPCCEKCLFAQEGPRNKPTNLLIDTNDNAYSNDHYHRDHFGTVSSESSTESITLSLSPSASRTRRPTPSITAGNLFQPTPPASRTPSPKEKSAISQSPCQGCHTILGAGKKLKVQLSSGSYAYFHKGCFVCSECRQSFNGDCVTNGELFYHSECDPKLTQRKKPTMRRPSFPQCSGCDRPIDSDACRFEDKMYHLNCFRCTDCKYPISPAQPVFIEKDLPYCKQCIDKPKITKPPSPSVSSNNNNSNGGNLLETRQPISLIPRQQRTLKLGGSKTCPRCKQTIFIMDETPGPLTTRWHKKCLCCAKCNKQLDSAAKVYPGTNGESVVYCRTCIDI